MRYYHTIAIAGVAAWLALPAAAIPAETEHAIHRSTEVIAASGSGCPVLPSSPALAVAVDNGYLTYRTATPAPAASTAPVPACDVALVPASPATPDGTTTGVTLSFEEKGLKIHYDVTQPTSVQASVRFDGISVDVDDNIAVLLRPHGVPTTLFTAAVNAKGHCVSFNRTRGGLLAHGQCDAKAEHEPAAGEKIWSGEMTIPYEVLADPAFGRAVDVRIRQKRHDRLQTLQYFSGGPAISSRDNAGWTPVRFNVRNTVANEQFVSFASNSGYNNGAPPHQISVMASLPLDPHSLMGATFADDSTKLLAKRDATLQDVLKDDDLFKAFKCVSCGSFANSRTAPFDPLVTSGNVLGIDFSDLGVDAVPFSFKAINYPLDSAYKALFADENIALAAMNGTATSGAAARDVVFRLARQFVSGPDTLSVGVYHAAANRSSIPTPDPNATYAPLVPALGHTDDTTVSVGFSHATIRILKDPANPIGPVARLNAIVRYGTQYRGLHSQRIDVAVGQTIDPPTTNLEGAPASLPQWAWAGGYRLVGSGYTPLDGTFDAFLGLHGFYGKVQYANTKGDRTFSAFSVSAHHFSDAVQRRDVAIDAAAKVRLDQQDHFGLAVDYNVASIAASQAARALDGPVVVPDAAGGTDMLPNSSFSPSFTYDNKKFVQASLGYTRSYAQNCDLTRTKSPCFAYRQPSVTASLLMFPFSDVFVDAAIAQQNNEALGLFRDVASGTASGQQTTAAHIVRKAAVGAYLFADKCSTLVVSTENRGGNVDMFANGPPQPGFVNTIALELQHKRAYPSLLVAFARSGDLTGSPTTEFLVRLRYGVPPRAFLSDARSACDQR